MLHPHPTAGAGKDSTRWRRFRDLISSCKRGQKGWGRHYDLCPRFFSEHLLPWAGRFLADQTIKIKLISISLDVVNLVILFFLWFRNKPCNKKCRQKLPNPLQTTSLTRGKSHKSSCQGSNGSPQAFATPAEMWFLNFAAFWKPHGFLAKNRNSSKLKQTRPFLAHDRSCFGADLNREKLGEAKLPNFDLFCQPKLQGERQTKSVFSKHHPFFGFTKLLWRSHTCFDL